VFKFDALMATVSFTAKKQGIASLGLVARAIAVVRFIAEAANAVVRGNKKLLSEAHPLFRNMIRKGLRVIRLRR
jgi:hypothetical protein